MSRTLDEGFDTSARLEKRIMRNGGLIPLWGISHLGQNLVGFQGLNSRKSNSNIAEVYTSFDDDEV
jgi:hypothetical protein